MDTRAFLTGANQKKGRRAFLPLELIIFTTICLIAFAMVGCHSPKSKASPSVSEIIDQNKRLQVPAGERALYGPPHRLGTLEEREIEESSGIVASRKNADLFWTHNDSGDGPYLYAFDRSGRRRGVWRVAGARSRDWEDIAAGPGSEVGQTYLYIGDIGDNGLEREQVTLYRVAEPTVSADDAVSSKNNPRLTEKAEAINLKYPDGSHNAEALLVHPISGDIYIVTKEPQTAASVYKLAPPFSTPGVNTLTRVGQVEVPALMRGYITGGDISPDGRRVVLCDYFGAYELSLEAGLSSAFDSIWKQPALAFDVGEREQGEGIGYSFDGESVLVTSEKRHSPLTEIKRVSQ